MKTLTLSFCFALALLSACTNNPSQLGAQMEIDVVTGLQNLTALKASDFGTTIRYIPLETTDDCLIGNNPHINVLKDKIVVTTRSQCFVFDKATGKFISSVGHIGEDPEGYASTMNWADENKDMLYFCRQPNWLMKYDMQGKYSGKVELTGLPSYLISNQSGIVAYYSDVFSVAKLAFYDNNGGYNDSITALLPPLEESVSDINSVSVLNNINLFGNWAQSGIILIDYKSGKRLMASPNSPVLWHNNGDIRFKENFGDTIYTIKQNKLETYAVFNTGDYHWPVNERTNTENNNKRIIVPYVAENDKSIFFQCNMGLYADTEIKGELSFLNKITEDMNPVVVLVRP
ncbi:DUF4934 domain-containing protein [Bacteroides sp. 519]|uniref:DUF4934 domain-containing protein n=1 Tax=Bacteroides sp. 519 TaxID=2302937 RepID=UPI0013D4CCB6|nr:DUF4934 domain-containing protein [Bacteroides sp. 519]NDV58098.1 DUF4934 domain-containing protein [Bacteroides sp. 519]